MLLVTTPAAIIALVAALAILAADSGRKERDRAAAASEFYAR
jgi:hypothetical protein